MFIYHSPYNGNKKPRITFVGEIVDGVLIVAGARCSKKDQFNRKRGVHIASERLKKGKYLFSAIVSKENPGKDFREVAKDNLSLLETPEKF